MSGIPRVSVLGPHLFVIYKTDLDVNVDALVSKVSKCANDTRIAGVVNCVEDR